MSNTATNRDYYDAFAAQYERERGGQRPGGYHDLVDRQEAQFVQRFGKGKSILEVGCGTGLVLERIAQFASHAEGVDLSPQMLKQARNRGLQVQEAEANRLPFANSQFDVVCSFKVLAHIQDLDSALSEMIRVVRPGGYVLAEFYNPWSLRALLKRALRPGQVATAIDESQVFTRYDSPSQIKNRLPPSCRFLTARGIRIVIPSASAMRIPGLNSVLTRLEESLCDSAAANLAGFWIAALRKLP